MSKQALERAEGARHRRTALAKATASPSVPDTTPRNVPRQLRSRQRQQDLLDAAEEIIAEVGLDGLSMREVGRRADLPIASIYHYYPSASALVRALAERQLEMLAALVQGAFPPSFAGSADSDTLATLAVAIIDQLATHLSHNRAAPAIWNALKSNPELRSLDRADTERVAEALAPAIGALRPDASVPECTALAVIILETVATGMTFALESAQDVRPVYLDALKTSIAALIQGLAQNPAHR